LRACVDLRALGEMTVTLDCDVLNADGGTRCASITGAWVALAVALNRQVKAGALKASPIRAQVAAISCGLTVEGAVLDLDYVEDSSAQADTNFVLTAEGGLVEVQATAEQTPFTEAQFNELLGLAKLGTARLFEAQSLALAAQS
jgi:ribonuclease PH